MRCGYTYMYIHMSIYMYTYKHACVTTLNSTTIALTFKYVHLALARNSRRNECHSCAP